MISQIKKSSWLQDIRRRELVLGVAAGTAFFGLILYLFYESLFPAPILFPVWILYMKEWAEDMAGKKEMEFRLQFRDCIQTMSAALKAGYSAENSIRETRKDLESMYGKDTRIMKELDIMIRQLHVNIPTAQILDDFSQRAVQEDVRDFVNVFSTAKKSGGDSIGVIRNAVKIISEKIDTEKEIQTILASKKFEFQIMCVIPFGIILYMKLTFGEFLEVLYENTAGNLIMTVCLILYITAYKMGKKLIQIEI